MPTIRSTNTLGVTQLSVVAEIIVFFQINVLRVSAVGLPLPAYPRTCPSTIIFNRVSTSSWLIYYNSTNRTESDNYTKSDKINKLGVKRDVKSAQVTRIV